MLEEKVLYTKKNRATRMHIGESLIWLMAKVPIEKIRMRMIAKCADISHVTLYNYYDSKISILKDYLNEIIFEYLAKSKKISSNFYDYESILFALKYFDKYAMFFKVMHKANLHSILLESINLFMQRYIGKDSAANNYSIYYYAGGLLNVFLKWQLSEKREPAEEIAKTLHLFSG